MRFFNAAACIRCEHKIESVKKYIFKEIFSYETDSNSNVFFLQAQKRFFLHFPSAAIWCTHKKSLIRFVLAIYSNGIAQNKTKCEQQRFFWVLNSAELLLVSINLSHVALTGGFWLGEWVRNRWTFQQKIFLVFLLSLHVKCLPHNDYTS